MKKLFFLVFISCFTQLASAQIKDPVAWTFEAKKKNADTYELVITANVPKPWHMYSQNMPTGGPVPTKVVFNNNPLVKKIGTTKETGKLEKINDKIFGMEVQFFSGKVVYTQQVKVKPGIKTNMAGYVNYMVCDDEQCLPPTKKQFDIKLL
ncbi:MAG: protein-disulfide reductase DsbD domain-containing protein [Sediminibacterium sp.]|jgi:thiol:disulfide interchange protein DsbD